MQWAQATGKPESDEKQGALFACGIARK